MVNEYTENFTRKRDTLFQFISKPSGEVIPRGAKLIKLFLIQFS